MAVSRRQRLLTHPSPPRYSKEQLVYITYYIKVSQIHANIYMASKYSASISYLDVFSKISFGRNRPKIQILLL